jgi:hypothetical protein
MVGIVFGLPGQKRSHLPRILADTEELVARNLATEVSVTRFVPYPGTAVFNNPGRFGFARRQVPWELYQRREIRVADLVSQEDYAAFQRDKDYETLLRLSSDN